MAIVKANYTKSTKGAKATIRYIQHRPGKDDERTIRTLFGNDGYLERTDAYHIVDSAKKGTVFFRFIISPDPAAEDQGHDLNLRQIAERSMNDLSESLHKPVLWVGAEHADHTPYRHVHLVAAVPARLQAGHFQRLRLEATQAALEQKEELDQRLKLHTQTREEAEWGRGC